MPDSITYGSYSFPDPLPAIAESDTLIKVAGKYDHKSISIQAIGLITGAEDGLSGLYATKMEMVSGFLDEYQDLTITVGSDERVFSKCLVNSIQFADSNMTTTLPYTVNFTAYEDETFSEYFGIENPVNNWRYSEQDGKIITATHTVSARGIKVDATDPFTNARNFVTNNLNGFESISLFNTGVVENGFLTSRTENIDRKSDTYGVTEVYSYAASQNRITDSGVLTSSTNIEYSKDGGLSVTVQGSLQGSIDAMLGNDILTTGHFHTGHATKLAINSINNSNSNFEDSVYSFVANGPTAFDYTLDKTANKLDFSFRFDNADNLDMITGFDVMNIYDVNISCSKDSPIATVAVQGTLNYYGISNTIHSTGTATVENDRFKQVSGAFEALTGREGIYGIAKDAMIEFESVANNYELNSSYLNKEPINFSITKDPANTKISYNFSYNNSIDYSNGELKDFKAKISDKRPTTSTKVHQTIGGFQSQTIADRTLGEYSVSASSNDAEGKLDKLKEVTALLCSGDYKISDSHAININNISYNLSKFY